MTACDSSKAFEYKAFSMFAWEITCLPKSWRQIKDYSPYKYIRYKNNYFETKVRFKLDFGRLNSQQVLQCIGITEGLH